MLLNSERLVSLNRSTICAAMESYFPSCVVAADFFEFGIHLYELPFFVHSMSLNIDMKMLRSSNFSGSTQEHVRTHRELLTSHQKVPHSNPTIRESDVSLALPPLFQLAVPLVEKNPSRTARTKLSRLETKARDC